jgi:hypothetical protein
MKLPPFGKNICLNPTLQHEIYLFIGQKAWGKASRFNHQRPSGTLCLPPYLSAFNYEWPVKDKEILMFDTGYDYCEEDYIDEIVKCLFYYGSNCVRFISIDYKLTVFKKGAAQ